MKVFSSFKCYVLFQLLIFTISHYSYAQKKEIIQEIDSSFISIINTPDTYNKVDNLIDLFKKSSKNKYINYQIIDSAISLGNRLLYIEGLGKAYENKGLSARYNYDYYIAIENHKRALTYLEKSDDTLQYIKSLNNIGVAYRKVNIEDKSFNYYYQAYILAEDFNHIPSQAIALNGIGNIFINIKKYKTALYYFKKALNLEESTNNKRGIEYDLANVGEVYLYLNEYDSALTYTNRALRLSLNNGKDYTEGPELSLIGKIYQSKGNYEKSNNYYQRALDIFDIRNSTRYKANALINIGNNLIALNRNKEGLQYIHSGLKNAKIIGSRENVLEAYNSLANYYAKSNEYEDAFIVYHKAISLKDSMLNEKSQHSIISSQIAFETRNKDKEIKKLAMDKQIGEELIKQNRRRLNYGSIGGSVILIAILIIFFLYRKNARLEIANLNGEIQNYVLNAKANSHRTESIQCKIALYNLSKREREVLAQIVNGLTNDEIAERLFISKNTVKYHSKNIYSKLDVKNRIQVMKKVESNN